MDITIKDPQKSDYFALIFQHIKLFSEHINIIFKEEYLYVQAMDSSRVSIVEIKLVSSWFDEYKYTEDMVVGINTVLFYKILNSRDKNQMIQIEYSKEEEKIFIHFTSNDSREFDKHFEFSTIEIDEEMMNIPDVDYPVEFSLISSNFSTIINQLQNFGDNIDISCSEDKISLSSSSLDQGKMNAEIKINDLTEFSINENETINASFSLKMLHKICLYNKLSEEVFVKLSCDFPMKISYKLLNDEKSSMVFYLAPKVNDE